MLPKYTGRRGGLLVSALDSGVSGPGLSPDRGHCVSLGRDTLLSQCLSPPNCINGGSGWVGGGVQMSVVG